MVQVVVLSANGESRTLKTTAFAAGGANGASVAKALRKKTPADFVGAYTTKSAQKLVVWGWKAGKAGTENKHELPPMGEGGDEGLLFGDAIVACSGGDYTVEQWEIFYDEAFGGFESLDSEGEGEGDDDYEEEEEEADEEEEEETEEADEEKEEEVDEDGDADEEDEEEEEEDMEDDDCYDEGDENGGGAKRRAPRRRTVASPECRRIDMGLRSRIKLPAPLGKRAPRWQTAPELEAETYD